jgi:CBS domain-containing protein
MKVEDILGLQEFGLITVEPSDLLSDAVVLMADKDIGSVVVVDHNDELVGMLTFREVLKILAKRQTENRSGKTPTMSEIKVEEVMNSNPTQTSSGMGIDELRRIMNRCGERYLPCVDAKTVKGVVSFHDVAKAMLKEQDFENRMLKSYIQDWPDGQNTDEK